MRGPLRLGRRRVTSKNCGTDQIKHSVARALSRFA